MTLRNETHRICMSEVDAAQVIYYASPYHWREAIFTAWLAEVGHPLRSLLDAGLGLPCVSSSAKYLRPLRLDDVVGLELRAGAVGTSSFGMVMDVRDPEGELGAQVETTNVWLEPDAGELRPAPLPQWLRERLEGT